MKTASVTVNHGQLTIPEAIRKIAKWLSSSQPVSVTLENPEVIKITPAKKEVDWDKLWKMIDECRAVKGKGEGNLSKFIAEDRQRHR